MTPDEVLQSIQNMFTCYKKTNFKNDTWDSYLKQQSSSITHPRDDYINGILKYKWKAQHPDVRLKYKRVKNKNATHDGVKRIQTLIEVQDYARRFKYRDAIFDIPLGEVEEMFGTWSQDRYIFFNILL